MVFENYEYFNGWMDSHDVGCAHTSWPRCSYIKQRFQLISRYQMKIGFANVTNSERRGYNYKRLWF